MSGTVTNPSTVYSGQTSSTTGAYPGQTGQYTQNAYLNGLNTFSNTPFQGYGGEMTAGINPIQNTAAYDQLGLAQYQPQSVSAGNIAQYAGGNGPGGLSMQGMNLGGYMSPYTSGVINTSMDQLNRQLQQTNVASDGQAAQAGAFGGDRAQIVDTENARNTNQIAAQTIAGLNQSNYTNAQGLATGDLNRELQAGTQQAGLNLQAGQGNQFAGLQGANLQNSANNSAFQMGTAFQNTNQTADTNAYGQYLRAFQYPFQQAQGAAGLTQSYAPSLQYQGTQTGNTSGISTPPAPSTASQITGGITAAAGLGGLLFGNGSSGSGGGSNSSSGLLGLAGSAGNYLFGTSGNGTTAATPGLISNVASGIGNGISDAANWVSNLFEGGGRVGLLAYANGGRIGYDDGGTVDDPSDGTYVAVDNSQAPNIDAQAVASGVVPGAVQDLPDGPAVPIAAGPVDQKGLAAQAEMAKPRRERSANPSAPIPTHEDSSHGSVQPPDISTAPAVSVPGDNDLVSRPPLQPMGPQGLMGAAMAPQPQGLPQPRGAPGGQSPDMIDSMYARGGNSWAMPVLAAGLGMMASKSPYFAQGIGEGGLAGMQEAQNVSQMRMAQAAQAQKLALGQQQLRGATAANDVQQARLAQYFGGPSSGGATGAGGPSGTSGGLAGAVSGGANGQPGAPGAPQQVGPKAFVMTPQSLAGQGQLADIMKPGSGAAYMKIANDMAKNGYAADGNGNIGFLPGYLDAMAQKTSTQEFAKLPAEVQKAVLNAQIRTNEAYQTPRDLGNGQIGTYAGAGVAQPGGVGPNPAGVVGPPTSSMGAPGTPVVNDTRFQNAVKAASGPLGVDPSWAMNIHAAETGNARNAMGEVSRAGARGGMQLMPGTAGGMGVNPDNGPQNAAGGVAYLAQLQEKYGGNKVLATAAFNAGPGKVDAYLKNGSPLPAETIDYVGKVMHGDGQQLLGQAATGGQSTVPGIVQKQTPGGNVATVNTRPLMDNDYKDDQKVAAEAADHVTDAQASLMRVTESRQYSAGLATGSGGQARMDLANAMKTYLPGNLGQKLVDAAPGYLPDPAKAQPFVKLMVQAAGNQERGITPRGGLGLTELMLKANPSLDTDPKALPKLLNFQAVTAQAGVDYNRGLQNFIAENAQTYRSGKGAYTPSTEYDRQWSQQNNNRVYMAALGIMNGDGYNKWGASLSPDEGRRAIGIAGSIDPSTMVPMARSAPVPASRFMQAQQ